jgi:D-amino-acid dehydrogenase
MNKREEIIIIGGGVIGACIAYYLSGEKHDVTLVEKNQICSGSSHGNAGLISCENPIPMAEPGVIRKGLRWMLDPEGPFYIKPRLDLSLIRWLLGFCAACREKPMRHAIDVTLAMKRISTQLSGELTAENKLTLGWEKKGRMLVYQNDESFKDGIETLNSLKQYGVIGEILDSDGVREKDPNLLPSVIGGIYYPGYEHVLPERYVKGMARIAENKGVTLQTETEVIGFETSGNRISKVVTTRGDFIPEQVVLAGGSWSPLIAKDLGLRLPIQPAKGYSITVKRTPTCSEIPLSLADHKVAVTPMGEFLRFSSNLELVGYDTSINRRRIAATRRAVNMYLSGIDELELVRIWSGFRPNTPDTLPIIERNDTYDNLILATGHDMLGMTHSLITGKLVSEIIDNETPSVDLNPFRLSRFH